MKLTILLTWNKVQLWFVSQCTHHLLRSIKLLHRIEIVLLFIHDSRLWYSFLHSNKGMHNLHWYTEHFNNVWDKWKEWRLLFNLIDLIEVIWTCGQHLFYLDFQIQTKVPVAQPAEFFFLKVNPKRAEFEILLQ